MLERTVSFQLKELYNPKAFFTHAEWLDQGCPHCPKFPTAASRRSLDRVSVPVWRIILSDPLLIVALVEPLPHQLANQTSAARITQGLTIPCFPPQGVCGISTPFGALSPITRYVPTHYSPVRHSPPGASSRAAVRLACVKHSASVQSEPGSNSSVQSLLLLQILHRSTQN